MITPPQARDSSGRSATADGMTPDRGRLSRTSRDGRVCDLYPGRPAMSHYISATAAPNNRALPLVYVVYPPFREVEIRMDLPIRVGGALVAALAIVLAAAPPPRAQTPTGIAAQTGSDAPEARALRDVDP